MTYFRAWLEFVAFSAIGAAAAYVFSDVTVFAATTTVILMAVVGGLALGLHWAVTE